jgi:hypothetical protein
MIGKGKKKKITCTFSTARFTDWACCVVTFISSFFVAMTLRQLFPVTVQAYLCLGLLFIKTNNNKMLSSVML